MLMMLPEDHASSSKQISFNLHKVPFEVGVVFNPIDE